MRRAGYSLIELLVVIAILGILAGIGTYTFGAAGAKSRDNTRKTDLARISNALQQYYVDNRQYPNFDYVYGGSAGTRMYSAVWQLSASAQAGSCQHTNSDLARRLTPTYLEKIPEDMRQSVNFRTHPCDVEFLESQTDRYYYLSGPSETTGPKRPATAFALMAHLERPTTADQILPQDNPLVIGNRTFLGAYYTAVDNYGGDIAADVNYLVTGRLGR